MASGKLRSSLFRHTIDKCRQGEREKTRVTNSPTSAIRLLNLMKALLVIILTLCKSSVNVV